MSILEEIRAALKVYGWRANIYMSPALLEELIADMRVYLDTLPHSKLPAAPAKYLESFQTGNGTIGGHPVIVTDTVERFRVGEADGKGAFSPVEGKAE